MQINLRQAKNLIKEGKKVVCYAEVGLCKYRKTICETLKDLDFAKNCLHNQKISNLVEKSKIVYYEHKEE